MGIGEIFGSIRSCLAGESGRLPGILDFRFEIEAMAANVYKIVFRQFCRCTRIGKAIKSIVMANGKPLDMTLSALPAMVRARLLVKSISF